MCFVRLRVTLNNITFSPSSGIFFQPTLHPVKYSTISSLSQMRHFPPFPSVSLGIFLIVLLLFQIKHYVRFWRNGPVLHLSSLSGSVNINYYPLVCWRESEDPMSFEVLINSNNVRSKAEEEKNKRSPKFSQDQQYRYPPNRYPTK